MAVINLTEENFNSVINSGKTVMVDFCAKWCGACKVIAPIVDELEKNTGDKAVIAKVDIDEQQSLSDKYNIMSIPAIFVFKNAKLKKKITGVPYSNAKKILTELIEKHID